MKNKFGILFLIASLSFFNGNSQLQAGQFIASTNKNISYMGRIGIKDSCAELYWTGSSITVIVSSTASVKALLEDDNGNNYYYVIVDGNGAKAVKIKIDKAKKYYTLANNLTANQHKIELFKVTNTDFITTRFYGFEIDKSGKTLKPDAKQKRKIEFFGNSITCGHGVEDSINGSGEPQFFNNYKAYGAITARHFDAQYHCTSKSGIGITISWFSEIMPEIYDRLNAADPNSKWDFSKYVPDIVVVNLFQNDSWLVEQPNHPQFKARFGNKKPSEDFMVTAYKNFLQSLRSKYPRAQIICCLGNMDATKAGSKWPGYIGKAVALLNDDKLVAHFFPFKNTGGHPNIQEQQTMADDLISFIEQKKYWN